MLGCKVASFPTSYLGLPLCKGKPSKSFCNKIIEKMEKILSLWKGRHLSIDGRIIFIKSVLSTVPVYFLSVFKCPVEVINKVESIQKRFLWNDDRDKRKVHLVSWSQICKSVVEGSVGIRLVCELNIALLGKWLW